MLPDPTSGIARGPRTLGFLPKRLPDRHCAPRTALAAAYGSGLGPSLPRRGSFGSDRLPGSWPRPRGPCQCNVPGEAEFTHLGARCERMYGRALEAARSQDFEAGRTAFEELLEEFPGMCKAWVSYAQMEKRATRKGRKCSRKRWESVRQVLQRGMTFNPHSACLAQAWGLMELQKGNTLGAVMLLDRSVSLDPNCSPVLRWRPVIEARTEMRLQRALKTAT